MDEKRAEAIRLLERIQHELGDAESALRSLPEERNITVVEVLGLMLNLAVGIGHIVAMLKGGPGSPTGA